jgi:hypothetical protein
MKCDRCETDGLTEHSMNFEVRGYEKKRAQGGANQIAARRETGRKICDLCLVQVKNGISLNQGTLV